MCDAELSCYINTRHLQRTQVIVITDIYKCILCEWYWTRCVCTGQNLGVCVGGGGHSSSQWIRLWWYFIYKYPPWVYILMQCGMHIFASLFCFDIVLHHINSILVISWQWYDIRDEEEKAWANSFTDTRDLKAATPHRNGMRGTGLWWRCKLYTLGEWIATQLNGVAVTRICIAVTMVTNPVRL